MTRKHYEVGYRLDGIESYLIWFSNDSDGVVVESDGSVPSFRAQSELCAYAERRRMSLEPQEPSIVATIAKVERWIARSAWSRRWPGLSQ